MSEKEAKEKIEDYAETLVKELSVQGWYAHRHIGRNGKITIGANCFNGANKAKLSAFTESLFLCESINVKDYSHKVKKLTKTDYYDNAEKWVGVVIRRRMDEEDRKIETKKMAEKLRNYLQNAGLHFDEETKEDKALNFFSFERSWKEKDVNWSTWGRMFLRSVANALLECDFLDSKKYSVWLNDWSDMNRETNFIGVFVKRRDDKENRKEVF